jgi:molybdopterin converting factor small subunit
MKITILYFASAKEATKCSSEIYESEIASISIIKKYLANKYPKLELARAILSVNQEYTEPDQDEVLLKDGDEIAYHCFV